MAYLHNSSDVSVHGKLRSCNCLIDGRFVLKISDFGLRTLTTPSEFIKDQNFFNSKCAQRFSIACNLVNTQKLFFRTFVGCTWTFTNDHHTRHTGYTEGYVLCGDVISVKLISIVTGDVYSFAIILEEIVVRGELSFVVRKYFQPTGLIGWYFVGGPYETARQYLDSKGWFTLMVTELELWNISHIL